MQRVNETRIEFKDQMGVSCSLQISSSVVQPCVWLGSDEEQKRHHVTGQLLSSRMHLTREIASEMIELLQVFVDTGELPDQREDGASDG